MIASPAGGTGPGVGPGEPAAAGPGVDVGGDGLPPLGGGAGLAHHVVVHPLGKNPEILST